jgi:MYXO-CTERM domain-containing protein
VTRLTHEGTPVGADIELPVRGTFAATPTTSLIAWKVRRADGQFEIRAARIDASGALLDPPEGVLVRETSPSGWSPWVGTDGTDFLLLWVETHAPGQTAIWSAQIRAADATVAAREVVPHGAAGLQPSGYPRAEFGDGHWLMLWDDGVAGPRVIRATRLTRDGARLDVEDPVVSDPDDRDRTLESLAYDGAEWIGLWPAAPGWASLGLRDIEGVRLDADGRVVGRFVIAHGVEAVGATITPSAPGRALITYSRFDLDPLYRAYQIRARAYATALAQGAACVASSQCATGLECTAGACAPPPAPDAGSPDAGSADAGAPPPANSGCACTVGAAASPAAALLLPLLAVALAFAGRRRPRPSPARLPNLPKLSADGRRPPTSSAFSPN